MIDKIQQLELNLRMGNLNYDEVECNTDRVKIQLHVNSLLTDELGKDAYRVAELSEI